MAARHHNASQTLNLPVAAESAHVATLSCSLLALEIATTNIVYYFREDFTFEAFSGGYVRGKYNLDLKAFPSNGPGRRSIDLKVQQASKNA